MTRYLILAAAFGGTMVTAKAQAQAPESFAVTATVRLTQPVTANARPLAPGTYEIRLTPERPTLPSGALSATQRWVEFLSGGTVVAREIAEVAVPDPASHPPSGNEPRAIAQLLKEGDFVRVSVWEGGERYLVYLPTGAAAPSSPASGAVPQAGVIPR